MRCDMCPAKLESDNGTGLCKRCIQNLARLMDKKKRGK